MRHITITVRNDFHNSEARVRVYPHGETILSRSTVLRVRRALCGIEGCCCGGCLEQRDPYSDWMFDEMTGGEVMVRAKERC